MHPYKKTMTQN